MTAAVSTAASAGRILANRAAIGAVGRVGVGVGHRASNLSGISNALRPSSDRGTATAAESFRNSLRSIQARRRPRCESCGVGVHQNQSRAVRWNHNGGLVRSNHGSSGPSRQEVRRRPFSTKASSSRRQRQQQKRTILTSNALSISNATPTAHPVLAHLLSSLRHTLLKPRSLPLPRYISPQHYSFTLSECFGHSSFILVAASYATQDFLELRILAVVGSTAMLFFTYFHPHGRILWLPLQWNVLFIAINSYRIGRVLFDRYMAKMGVNRELKEFREEHLGVIDSVDYWKLVRIAREEVYEEGDLVLHQGTANPNIRIVLEGELEVLRDGTLTYVLEKGNFVSESGLHAGLMLHGTIESCGSIVVGPPFDPSGQNNAARTKKNRVRCLTWDRTELMDLLENNRGLRTALKAALSWDVVRKLKMQRHMLTEGRVRDPTAWTRKREDQGIARYASILQNMLRRPEEFVDMGEVLTQYRRIHRIDDADHRRALAHCGWTEEEFREGKRREADDYEDEEEEEEMLMFSDLGAEAKWRGVKRYSSKLVRSLLQ